MLFSAWTLFIQGVGWKELFSRLFQPPLNLSPHLCKLEHKTIPFTPLKHLFPTFSAISPLNFVLIILQSTRKTVKQDLPSSSTMPELPEVYMMYPQAIQHSIIGARSKEWTCCSIQEEIWPRWASKTEANSRSEFGCPIWSKWIRGTALLFFATQIESVCLFVLCFGTHPLSVCMFVVVVE